MDDEKLTLVEHLDELRTRIIRALLYIFVGIVIGWVFYPWMYKTITWQVLQIKNQLGGKVIILDITEGFWLRMQASFLSGVILSLPFILLEVWGFVKPGLTSTERKYVKVLPSAITLLFISGLAFGYWMAPTFARWMLSPAFVPPGAEIGLRLQSAPVFMAKVMLAFGLSFQMPLLVLALNRLGILPLPLLKKKWREAIMAILAIGAIITPTPDPFSMMLASLPLTVLYLGTLGVIWLLDRKERKRLSKGRESAGE